MPTSYPCFLFCLTPRSRIPLPPFCYDLSRGAPASSYTEAELPITVFDTKGIPATRRERIETAVDAGGKHMKERYEPWITADPFRGGIRVLITGGRESAQNQSVRMRKWLARTSDHCWGRFRSRR